MGIDPNRPLNLISFRRIIEEPVVSVEWDVEGLLPRASRGIVFAEFGGFKSWALLSLALHVAAGIKWLGQFVIPESRQVLYIDEEMGEHRLRHRVRRLALGMDIDDRELPFQAICRADVRFDDQGATNLLVALDKSQFDPQVIIAETLRRVLVGSENEQESVSGFWRNVEPIVRADKSLVLSHHMRKPNRNGPDSNRDRASGSTDILAGADVAIAVDELPPVSMRIETTKQRDAEEYPAFQVEFLAEDPDGAVTLLFSGLHTSQRPQTKVDQAKVSISLFLAEQPDRTAETRVILRRMDALGIKKRTAEQALAVMAKKEGQVRALLDNRTGGALEVGLTAGAVRSV